MECFLDDACFANPFFLSAKWNCHSPSWLRLLLLTELNTFSIVRFLKKGERERKTKTKNSVLFSLLWVLVFVICSSVVCKPHFPVSARYSNQRANKNNLAVNVYSWEEKTVLQHSLYVSENSRWDFKVWQTPQSPS